MTPPPSTATIHIRAWPGGGAHAPEDPYTDAVWLPILGPTRYVVWRYLVAHTDTRTTLHDLAAAAGIGNHQSTLVRALRRLERLDVIDLGHVAVPTRLDVVDSCYDCIAVRTRLPYPTPSQIARLDPAIQAIHHQHTARLAAS